MSGRVRRPRERKYRRCQECGHVAAASAFRRVLQQGMRFAAELRVICPGCGYVAPYWAFVEVEPPRGERAPS